MTPSPVATYRLQFREGTTFETAADLAPYLKKLGISHLYASPIFSASPGSTHGYDVTDYNAFEADLGGDAGFLAMSDALAKHDLGLILDFVPNHMGVSPKNKWWEDVLRWGADSRYADVFDISWVAEKILVPVLGKPYGEALEMGDLQVVLHPERNWLRFDAAGYQLPLDPRTFALIFARLDHGERDRLLRRFAVATPAEIDELRERLAEHLEEVEFADALNAAIESINADRKFLHELHEAQAWRLAWWRTAREQLTYRRFFEIADLIGVRQESRRVFRESHQTVIRLARERRLDGIRIDHVDGVADPKAYLADLKQAFQSVRRSPMIHVEKILTGDERLRTSWDIEGTTGYEFITALSGLFVDPAREEAMDRAYSRFLGEEENLRAMIAKQKRAIFHRNLAGELAYLTGEAMAVAARGLSTRDLGADTIARSIVEVAVALPVYRTYVSVNDGVPTRDAAIIDETVEEAQRSRQVEADEPIQFIGRLLKLDFEAGEDVAGALNFTRRFQQTTGAVMAKAVEDTVFYRYNRLIALNEVGGEPDHYGADVEAFHEAMAIRVEDQPLGLLATSTHDTKRGEDARARLYALSEAPERWDELVQGFADALSDYRKEIEPGLVSPDAPTEWGFYQSLLGVLPADFDPESAEQRDGIKQRLTAFMEKAVREAKRWTSWTSPAEPYEGALRDFVAAALDPEKSEGFLPTFWRDAQPFVVAGALNSLAQTAIKLAAPGIPDIYQGTEFYDFSLVDPDNRRAIDFADRQSAFEGGETAPDLLDHWRDGRVKAKITAEGLAARAAAPDLFTRGAYVALEVTGVNADHVVAFARIAESGGPAAICVAPRLALTLLGEGASRPMVEPAAWGDTAITIPEGLRGRGARDLFAETRRDLGETLKLSEAFSALPVSLLLID